MLHLFIYIFVLVLGATMFSLHLRMCLQLWKKGPRGSRKMLIQMWRFLSNQFVALVILMHITHRYQIYCGYLITLWLFQYVPVPVTGMVFVGTSTVLDFSTHDIPMPNPNYTSALQLFTHTHRDSPLPPYCTLRAPYGFCCDQAPQLIL